MLDPKSPADVWLLTDGELTRIWVNGGWSYEEANEVVESELAHRGLRPNRRARTLRSVARDALWAVVIAIVSLSGAAMFIFALTAGE